MVAQPGSNQGLWRELFLSGAVSTGFSPQFAGARAGEAGYCEGTQFADSEPRDK